MKENEQQDAETEGESFWAEGSFSETIDPQRTKERMKTFHKKHDEDMNFNCVNCNVKISAHNKDWHGGMCDGCFNKKFFPED